jgi:hypothetical protein
MTCYEELISRATGLVDMHRIRMVESYMREIYFHSTLNWQDDKTLKRAARESAQDLAFLGWEFK